MALNTELMQILLVEDNPSDVELILTAFVDCLLKHKLNIVNDGEEALNFLYKRGDFTAAPRPNIILLDLNLPRQNGQEILQTIKSDPALKTIPVIILTSSSTERDIVKSYALHANCYIIKPVNLDKFLHIVRSIENFWLSIVQLPQEQLAV